MIAFLDEAKISHPVVYYIIKNYGTRRTNMEQINKTNRCCATCAYWLGQRFPHRLGYVEVISKMDGGRCAAKGLNEHRRYQAVYSCSGYCRWKVL